ncbi:secretin and TonB N-terminal domain-containing protein [Candidatus Sumerlaeota bacterium]|nr:secretin and TonB N-terminal domain-containing protein [Candidatus Sumerlaeota bacterium]
MRLTIVTTLTLAVALAASLAGAPETNAVDGVGYVPENAIIESVNVSTDITGDSFAALSSRSTEQVLDRLVNITFVNADLENALRIIARQMELNIIIGPGARGQTITLDLKDVPLRFALDAILRSNGLGYIIERGGIVRVVPAETIRPDAIERQLLIRRLNWQIATEMAGVLEEFISEEGQVRPDVATNSVVISDVPQRIEEIDALLDELDAPERQVMIEARLVDLSETALRQLRANFAIGQADDQTATSGAPWANAPFNPNLLTYPGAGGDDATFVARDALGVVSGALPDPAAVWTYGNVIAGYDVSVRLEAYEEEGLARVLAAPRVATINNIPAEIEIIREEPYVESTFNPGGQTTQSVLFKDVGLSLTVTPRITNNGYVRMKIISRQEILVGRILVEGSSVPQVARRQAESNVIIEDGGTVMVGGLRQMEGVNSEEGVPWFRQLPVIGWLFRGDDYSRERVDYYVFVTPNILHDPTLAAAERYAHDLLDLEWDLPEDYFFEDVTIETTY